MSGAAAATDAGERRAWGWVAALRHGDSTPWHAWAGDGDRTGRYLPGAQQLELLRRLNLAGPVDPTLAERVLTASAPGRGSPDLELVGAVDPPRWGPRPVDPQHLADAELVRVASGLLAEDLVSAGIPDPASPVRRTWPGRRRRPYRLVGDPWLADPVREHLTRAGHPPGGRGSTVVVLGTDVATMVAHAYTARAFTEGAPPWQEWLGTPRRLIPPRADLAGSAERWAARVSVRRLVVVLDPARLPQALGTRRRLPDAPTVAADAVDLAARIAAPLGLLVLPDVRAGLLRERLLPRLATAPGAPLGLPASHRGWARRRAERMRAALRDGNYAVLGDLDSLLPPAAPTGAVPDDAGVLALALGLLRSPIQEPHEDAGTEER